jgi:SAM-dependent methyltransferase
MNSPYSEDLAYIQAAAFGDLARGAAPAILRLLNGASIPIRRVLDVGCGAGPLAAILAREGFDVTGIDQSAELLEIARESAPTANFIHQSIYEAELPACEAILAVGEPLTYHAEEVDADSRLAEFFEQTARVLPIGGMLIFDVIELGESPLAGRFWRTGDDWAVMVDTQEDRASRSLARDIQTFRRIDQCYRRGREVHRVRLFDAQTLCDQLAAVGFSVETAQTYGAEPLSSRRRAFFCIRIPGR